MTAQSVGKSYQFDLGPLKVKSTFESPSQGSFVVEEGGAARQAMPTRSAVPLDLMSGTGFPMGRGAQ
ncbi:hypothetical protein DFP74_2444 [Nocardiopsis sp. Huas11]|uniref:hypothetical protein n=1 Tax=Nocardiopsis sp. Huas11 TaxID=2183912 RepID=UPI000EAE2006|nr:hypothetical protein [Nocardiopsis sp. Huas11]RKS06797.1 hypothetical protein DFP74_2444 [Nocardiopsis sp. Huas11]